MPLDNLIRTTLNNGLQVILRPSQRAPVASFWLFYRVGSRNEIPGYTGISHWVEHMLFKGTERYPRGEFDKAVARAGGVFNGMTWQDWTVSFETFPAERIDLALQVESDRMANAIFDVEETEAERTVILSEREGSENSYFYRLQEEVQAAAFLAHSYRNPVIGWQGDLLALTRDDLVRRAVIMALMCQGEVLFEPIEASWLIDFKSYFELELQQLQDLAEQGLATISDEGISVTPMGWYFVRAVAMVFDRYLQANRNRARFSRII